MLFPPSSLLRFNENMIFADNYFWSGDAADGNTEAAAVQFLSGIEIMSKTRTILISLACLLAGISIGGYLFSKSQPRPVWSLGRPQNLLNPKELAGLLASVGIRKLPGFIPFIVVETDKTIVIRHPFPLRTERIHYIIAPKKDIKNIGEISREDIPYLIDAHAVAREIIEREKLYRYRLYTNGPGFQHVAYLHFHLIDR